jgi:probable F420-dependent oxidoreductase
MRPFRFSFNIFGLTTREAFVAECRAAEALGYDAVFSADHLGLAAPFPVLIAAAEATQRLAVGTLVLNVPFWNAALLAREIATTDILTSGRLIMGLGAGHMKWEFDQAGIPWRPIADRSAAMEEMIGELERYFGGELAQRAGGHPLPRPVQRIGFNGTGPPLLIGGTGDTVLRIGARHAQIVGVAGAYQVKGKPPGTFRLGTAADVDERMRYARRCAGARAEEIEWHLLVQVLTVTDDRRAAAEQLLDDFRRHAEAQDGLSEEEMLTVDQALQTPFLLLGTIDEIAAQLRVSRQRWGFSFVTVHEPYMQAFAPVIERLHADDQGLDRAVLRRE